MDQFGYDNTPFLQELEKRGFYVTRCSQSNYSYTGVAMSSELNLDYLQEMAPDYFVPENSADRTLLSQMVRHSVVRESLDALGYITVDISSHEPIQIKDAEVFIDPNDRLVTNASADLFVNPFEAMFIRTTALAFPLDMNIARNRQVANAVNYPFLKHLRAQQYVLSSAERIISQRSPKFVFYHIDVPHPPFVFGPNGETYQRPEDVPGYDIPASDTAAVEANQEKLYRDQVIFINSADPADHRSHPGGIINSADDHPAGRPRHRWDQPHGDIGELLCTGCDEGKALSFHKPGQHLPVVV